VPAPWVGRGIEHSDAHLARLVLLRLRGSRGGGGLGPLGRQVGWAARPAPLDAAPSSAPLLGSASVRGGQGKAGQGAPRSCGSPPVSCALATKNRAPRSGHTWRASTQRGRQHSAVSRPTPQLGGAGAVGTSEPAPHTASHRHN
jgi:hypothetical protein